MLNFLALDQIAAERGDGLRPELRELLHHRSMIETNPKVEDLASWRGQPAQAGAHPSPGTPGHMPASILRFPDPRERQAMSAKRRKA